MRYEIKSTKHRLDHLEFVYALIPFITAFIEERGENHFIVEMDSTPDRMLAEIGTGFGPMTVIPE
jgi:hypothetical protein